MPTAAAPINVNSLLGIDEDFNFLNPQYVDPYTKPAAPAKPPLSEALRNHYNATAETPLGVGQLPPQVPLAPETLQAAKPLARRAGEATLGAAEAGAGYLNNAIRGHVKFLTGIGEGLTSSATGLVTGAAGMATSASDIVNTYAGRVAREGPFAGSPFPEATREMQTAAGLPTPAPVKESPTHFRDIFTRTEEATKGYSYEAKTPVGKAVAGTIALVPEAIKGVSDFISNRAVDLGMDPDKARVLSFGMELTLFYGLDKGLRAAAPELRSRVSDLRSKLRSAKTDADLTSPAVVESADRLAAAVDAHPEAGPALDAARARLVDVLKQAGEKPAANLTDILRQRGEQRFQASGGADISPTAMPELRTQGRDILRRLNENPDNTQTIADAGTYLNRTESIADPITNRLKAQIESLVPQRNLVADQPSAPGITAPVSSEAAGVARRAPGAVSSIEQRIASPDPLAQARAEVSPPTLRTTVDDVISGRVTPPEAAAVTAPAATPAPAVGDSPVAAAVPRTEIPVETSPARSLFERATAEGIEPKAKTAALGELKSLVRESFLSDTTGHKGVNTNEAMRVGLERLGFTPEEIRSVAPELRKIRTTKPAEPALVPTSPTTPATVTAPDALVSPTATQRTTAPSNLDFGGMFEGLAKGMIESRLEDTWQQYRRGSTEMATGVQDLTLMVAKELKNKGIDIPRERFTSMIEEVERMRVDARDKGLTGEPWREQVSGYAQKLAEELTETKRVNTETAQPGTQIAQTPEGELAYVKPTGEVIAPVEQLPAHQELAQAAPGTEVTLPPAPGIVDTAPVLEKPKRQRKVVKAKPEVSPVAAEEAAAEIAARAEAAPASTSARSDVALQELLGEAPLSEVVPYVDKMFRAGVKPLVLEESILPVLGVAPENARVAANALYDRFKRPTELPMSTGSPVVSYHSVRSMTELGERLDQPITEAGTASPERSAIQVRTSKSGAKPDAMFVDTTGLNTLTRVADIEKQVASGRMSKEVGDMSIANLRRQAELGDVPLSEAHTFNGQRLQREATLMADMLGLDLYVKKGKNYELVPKDVVRADAKLSKGDITTPSGVTKEEAAALADFKSGPIGPEQLKEILESSEKGLDISDRLPADLAPHYKTLVESERQGINLSERRNFIDMLKDANTLLGESGAIGKQPFSRERRMAAQRLEADARKIGSSFIDMFRNKLDPAEIPMFERYLERISNPEPPKGVGPGRMSLDPDALARGDQIVKHRMTNLNGEEVPKGPPLWESDVIPIYDAANPGRSTFRFLENPIYLMDKMGLKDPLYTAVRTAYHEYGLSLNAMRKDLKEMTSYFGPASRERIGAYAYSKSPEGMRLLEKAKVEVPTLTSAETRLYNEARGIYENFFNVINEVREATGHEPLMRVDNYFTFARSYSIMEKLGVLPDMLRHPPATINEAFMNHSTTPFPHERIRSGSTYAAEFDVFRLMDRYAASSLKQIHVAPVVAKLNELIETKLPDPKQTHLPWAERDVNWSLKEENPNAYNILHPWKEFIATGQSESFRMPKKIENFVTTVGNNLAYSLLSANLRSAAVQVSTIRNTFQSLGYIPTLEGLTRSIADVVSGERWNRAMDKSEVLGSRRFQDAFSGMEFSLTGFRPREFVGAVARGRFTELQGATAGAGMKFLEVMDMVSANVSWNAAYDHYLKKIGKDERLAIRYADDLVVRTQGSTMPGDLAAIQRSTAGKALTQFQTFLISDWNFLTHEVLGIGDKKMTWKDTAINAAKFVGTTSAFNVLFENVLNVQSPFPTPIKDIKRAIANSDDDPLKTAWRLAGGAVEMVPILGASRYQKSVAGPAVNTLYDFTRALAGAPLAPSPYEPLAKMAGVPATQQVAKSVRAAKRGENVYNALMGWYSQDEPGSNERSGRAGGGRGR